MGTQSVGDSATFSVVSTGEIAEGFDPAEVRRHLVSLLRLKPEQAERFFDRRRVVKQGVTAASAEKVRGQLARLGIVSVVEDAAPSTANADRKVAEHVVREAAPAAAPAALELVQDEPAAPTQGTATCPKCGHVQAASEQCERCGVWFHKFAAAPSQAAGSGSDAIPGADALAAGGASPAPSVPVKASADDEAVSPTAIAAAAGAALLGAWVWKFIAVTFEYEFGLIAWAIGGAVGIAAASTGSRGMKAGVVCGALALGAIVLGKYWAYSAIVDQVQQAIAGVTIDRDELYTYYEEEVEDAALLAAGSGSDDFVRQFMVDRGYTEATDPRRVSAEELSDFRTYTEPTLREVAETSPDFEQWQARTAEAIDEFSPWTIMREGFGWLDLLFVGLGIATAFRLGSQMG